MWIERDFAHFVGSIPTLPVKVLKGPRQVGKTTFLERLGTHKPIYLDDAAVRIQASENPRLFLDANPGKLILDEASLAPELFHELKRRVDSQRRQRTTGSRDAAIDPEIDVWITGSNQTLLQRNVQESLSGRASYFDFNTLSAHELGERWHLEHFLFAGGWPELYASPHLKPVRYLNDLLSTFVERDIVAAAGIERRAAFTKCLQLTAARVGQLYVVSDVAVSCSVDASTINSWLAILELNGIVRRVMPFSDNLNKRLIKSPKFYFEDVSLATRLQGWTELPQLLASGGIGNLVENVVVSEVSRFFLNRGETPRLNFVRSKEKVEVDLLVHLPNQRCIAIEIKTTPQPFTAAQHRLLDSLELNIVERWVVTPERQKQEEDPRVISVRKLWDELGRVAQ